MTLCVTLYRIRSQVRWSPSLVPSSACPVQSACPPDSQPAAAGLSPAAGQHPVGGLLLASGVPPQVPRQGLCFGQGLATGPELGPAAQLVGSCQRQMPASRKHHIDTTSDLKACMLERSTD